MRTAAIVAVCMLVLVCITMTVDAKSTVGGAVPKPVKIVGERGRDSRNSPVHEQAGENVAKIVPFATLVNKLPKGAKAPKKQTRSPMPVVHRLPPGFARYVNAHIEGHEHQRNWVKTVKEGTVGRPKIAFRYHLQRHQLPVLPEPSSRAEKGNDVNDPLFYHQHIFEKDPSEGPAVRKGAKLVKPWTMPACCGKPVVEIKKRRTINKMAPLSHYLTTKQKNHRFPVEPAYRARRHREAKVKPLKWHNKNKVTHKHIHHHYHHSK